MAIDIDLAAADHLLTTTRSVRRRLDPSRPVAREAILDCIRIAQQAPTGSNLQTWRWLVIDDPARRTIVAAAYKVVADDYLRAIPLDTLAPQARRVRESALHLIEVMADVPVLVIPCVQPVAGHATSAPPPYPNAVAAPLYGSIYPAVWSFQLAARARGLGTCLTTLHLHRESEVAEALAIPDGVIQAGLLPVAYYTGDTFSPAERPPPQTITRFNTWT